MLAEVCCGLSSVCIWVYIEPCLSDEDAVRGGTPAKSDICSPPSVSRRKVSDFQLDSQTCKVMILPHSRVVCINRMQEFLRSLQPSATQSKLSEYGSGCSAGCSAV